MSFRFTPFLLATAAIVLAAGPAFSQTVFVQGNVTDPDGKPVAGAQLSFTASDTNNKVPVKSDKKGHYVMSMKAGIYSVEVTVDGKVRFSLNRFEASGDAFDIKLKPVGQAAPASAALAARGCRGR